MNAIDAMTVAETGWTRISGTTVRWISELIGEGAGRSALELKSFPAGLGITSTWLPDDLDPADAEAVAAELDKAWPAVLPLPALIVLRTAIDSAITAMTAMTAAAEAGDRP